MESGCGAGQIRRFPMTSWSLACPWSASGRRRPAGRQRLQRRGGRRGALDRTASGRRQAARLPGQQRQRDLPGRLRRLNVRAGLNSLRHDRRRTAGRLQDQESQLRGVGVLRHALLGQGIADQRKNAGLLELPADAPVGQDVRTYLELDDYTIEVGLTPNRGDCLSLAGLAREVSAIYDVPLAPVAVDAVAAQHDGPVGRTRRAGRLPALSRPGDPQRRPEPADPVVDGRGACAVPTFAVSTRWSTSPTT